MERKSFVLCLVCSALFFAFFVAMPASSQPVKPQPLEKIIPPASPDDRELRDRMTWARGFALTDEFLVQYLMEAGVDPDRADKVRLMLLETRIYHRETILKIRSEMVGEEKRQDRIPRIADAAAARSAEDKQKLATVLTAKELEAMEASLGDAHLESVMYVRRHDEETWQIIRRGAAPVKPQAPEKTSPVSSEESSEDRNLRDRMRWARGFALIDEFLVQYLMEWAGVDPDRADKVRLILLESAIDREKTFAKARTGKPGYDERWVGRMAIARAVEDERKLATVLTAKELKEMKTSRSEAHFQSVMFLRRHDGKDDKPGR